MAPFTPLQEKSIIIERTYYAKANNRYYSHTGRTHWRRRRTRAKRSHQSTCLSSGTPGDTHPRPAFRLGRHHLSESLVEPGRIDLPPGRPQYVEKWLYHAPEPSQYLFHRPTGWHYPTIYAHKSGQDTGGQPA